MSRSVRIELPDAVLEGDLEVPAGAEGLVVFAHGSGSSRHSPRNRFVARWLQQTGLGTLLMDLLTAEEGEIDDQTREMRFDIGLLGRRVAQTIEWVGGRKDTAKLGIGLFGASTGAAAALVAAAELSQDAVRAVVSRGGRPDLAGNALPLVRCPVLLIVGGEDDIVIGLNEQAKGQMACTVDLAIVPGATHLFEEPGTLEKAADLAAAWFCRYLPAQ